MILGRLFAVASNGKCINCAPVEWTNTDILNKCILFNRRVNETELYNNMDELYILLNKIQYTKEYIE